MVLIEIRDIESIKLNINDNLIMYLSNGEEPSPDGCGSPFFVKKKVNLLRRSSHSNFTISGYIYYLTRTMIDIYLKF